MHDPFAQFERSRFGWLIPLVLFVGGAVPTAYAMRAMIRIEAKERADALPETLPLDETRPVTDVSDRVDPANAPIRNLQDIDVP